MKIYDDATCLVGNTPLIRLSNIEADFGINAALIAKAELFNPLSSSKDRVGCKLVKTAIESGVANENTLLIEPTSGNTGIGIAFAAAVYGMKAVIVMPDSMSVERQKVMRQLGAEVVLTKGALGMKGAIEEAERIKAQSGNAIILGQFDNPDNPLVHYETTGREIYRDTDGKVDAFVAGIGTGGTISGVGRYLKEKNKNVLVIGVEPEESPLITKGFAGSHGIQGIGANFVPKNYQSEYVDKVLTVSTADAIFYSKLLAKREGLLSGISSGAALFAAIKMAKLKENEGKNIVILLPDGGDRYISTPLFD